MRIQNQHRYFATYEEGNPIILKDGNLEATCNAQAGEVAAQVLELLIAGAASDGWQ